MPQIETRESKERRFKEKRKQRPEAEAHSSAEHTKRSRSQSPSSTSSSSQSIHSLSLSLRSSATMNNNPFQDPAVLHASSPSAPPKLDISHAASASMPPPPVISPSAAPPGAYQYGAATASPAAGNSPAHKHQHNLMDEIGDSIKATNSTTILRIMRTVNLLLATATIAVGLLAWIMGYVRTFQKVIAGIYIIMFGLLLLAFELRTEKVDRLFRQNFGFMYGNQTRTIFLLFIAIWPLSMGNFWLTTLDAVLLFVNAFFNYFVINQHPAFSHHTTNPYDAAQPGQQLPVAPVPGQQPTAVDTQV